MIVLITPTGARAEQVNICASLMARQTYKGAVLWVIVDDAEPRTTDDLIINPAWEVLKVYPRPPWQVGQNTQGRNLAAGVQAMISKVDLREVEAIFIIEDDDYYKPIYLETMVEKLAGYDAAGEQCTIYYNVKYRCWLRNLNYDWSSLFQTAFTPAALPLFNQIYGHRFIDCKFFPLVRRKNLFLGGDFSIGIKGQAGRAGIGMGHDMLVSYVQDLTGLKLWELIGNDANIYLKPHAGNRLGTG